MHSTTIPLYNIIFIIHYDFLIGVLGLRHGGLTHLSCSFVLHFIDFGVSRFGVLLVGLFRSGVCVELTGSFGSPLPLPFTSVHPGGVVLFCPWVFRM